MINASPPGYPGGARIIPCVDTKHNYILSSLQTYSQPLPSGCIWYSRWFVRERWGGRPFLGVCSGRRRNPTLRTLPNLFMILNTVPEVVCGDFIKLNGELKQDGLIGYC